MKKTFKTIALIMTMLMAFSLLFAGCNKDKDAKDKKNNEEEFIIGLDANFPPYGYKDKEGNIVGFDIDIAKEVAKRNNWKFKAQPIDWDAKDLELKSGTIDCAWNGFTINGREDKYTWTKPYSSNKQVVVVKKDSGIKTLKDLAGKTVIVQSDSSAEKTLTKKEDNKKMLDLVATFKDLQKVPQYDTAFLNLESGSADAVALDVGVAKFNIEKRGDKFVMLEEALSKEQYGIGFKKGNTELRDKVDKTLDEMKKDGTFMDIAEKWELQDSAIVD